MGLGKLAKGALKGIIKWAVSSDDKYPQDSPMPYSNSLSSNKSIGGPSINENRAIHFTVQNATGGKVIQIQTYDARTDRTNTALHVITDAEDLAEELAMIITRESMTR